MAQTRIDETTGDQWNEMAKVYKQLTVGTSYKPMGKMLAAANELVPFSEATAILDNGCGPGPVMTRILDEYKIPDSCSLTCCDFSEGMVSQVRSFKDEKAKEDAASPWSRVDALVQDATDLKDIQTASKSHITAGWVYFMTTDPQKCLTESKRVLKDGGVLTCSSWKGSQWMDLMNLFPKVRPDKKMFEVPSDWSQAEPLKAALERAGFRDVQSYEVETTMEFERLEPFVEFVLYKMPHLQMMAKDMTEEEMARLKNLMLEEGKKMCSTEPGTLKGTALVAVGRK